VHKESIQPDKQPGAYWYPCKTGQNFEICCKEHKRNSLSEK